MKINIPKSITHVVGIDEVGRGPLAGPVTIGAVCVSLAEFKKFPKRNYDSKVMNEKDREDLFGELKGLNYRISSVSPQNIDRDGIEKCLRLATSRCLSRLNLEAKETLVLLDGRLKAPKNFIYQQTIVKGDSKVSLIGAASIIAKVKRDARMKKEAKKYPEYGFEDHKGYGTKKHIQAICKCGPSSIHRRSFLKKILGNLRK